MSRATGGPKTGPDHSLPDWPPRIGAPATRALDRVGIRRREDLCHWTEGDLRALHGIGPRAVTLLSVDLLANGLHLRHPAEPAR